jgi:hypothetical protein
MCTTATIKRVATWNTIAANMPTAVTADVVYVLL